MKPSTSLLPKINNILLYYPIHLALVLICIFLSITSPTFFTWENLLNILLSGSVLGICAVGMTFVMLAGGIDISVGSILFLSSVSAAVLVKNELSGILAMLVMLVIASGLGAMNGLSVVRFKMPPLLVTLAMLSIARGLGLEIGGGNFFIGMGEYFNWLGYNTIMGVRIPVYIALMVFLLGHLILTKTAFGRHVFAVGNDQETARKAGIKVKRTLFLVYLISGFCAGLAGLVLAARLDNVDPASGIYFEFIVLPAVILGGTSLFGGEGGIPGTLIGVLLVTVIDNGIALLGISAWSDLMVKGGVIFLAVLIDTLKHKRRLSIIRINPGSAVERIN